MSARVLLELTDVGFTYPGRKRPALEGINFTLEAGQRIGLIGANGSGKTTLLHLIMGLLRPDTGRLLFQGKPLADRNDLRRLRKAIGLLFQDADDQLFSPTVLEDVAFGPLNLGADPAEAREIALRTLDRVGLHGFGPRVTHKLSGGEKKLVSLATVLAMSPQALLLDEPSNNLDPATREDLIRILNQLGIGYVIISHDWDFLAETCEEIFAMEQGRLARSDHASLHQHRHAHPCGEHPHHHGC